MTLLPLSRPWPAIVRGDVVFAVSDAGRTDCGLMATIHVANGRYAEAATLVLTQPAERLAVAERLATSIQMEAPAAARMLLDLVPPVEARVREDGGWGPPISLSAIPSLPAFPVEILPLWLKEYVEAVAEFSQTPPDLAGMLALAVLALAGQRLAMLEIRPHYIEPLNLYVLVAMGSGERKSAVYRALTGPVYDYEASMVERLNPERAKRAAERRILDLSLQRATLEAAKQDATPATRAHALDLAQQLAAVSGLAEPVLVIQDSTPEAMVRELAEQGGMLAALDAEGGLLDSLTGRYNDQGSNLDPLLKAHAGDEIRSARIGRGKVSVKQPALTMGITPQPEVLVALESKPGAKGRGLLARFLYGLPRSYKGRRKQAAAAIPPQVTRTYRQRIGRLLAASEPKEVGEQHPRATMGLTRGAYRAWLEFSSWLEPHLAPGALLGGTDGWAEKLAGQTARIAANLHLADGEHPLAQCAQPMSAGAMERAVAVAVRYLVPHAMAAFRSMGADPAVGDAQTILAWIERNDRTDFTARQVYKDLGTHFARPEAVLPGLETLVRHEVLRERTIERAGPGRKPSPTYAVNPRLGRNRQNRQNGPQPEGIDLLGVLTSFDRNRQNSGAGGPDPHSVHLCPSATSVRDTPAPVEDGDSVYSAYSDRDSALGTSDQGEIEL